MRRASLVFLTLGVLLVSGCRPERAPTREQRAQQRKAEEANTPLQAPAAPNIDDAELIISRCGPPLSDEIVSIYTKLHNGPVRRLVYNGKQEVRMEFIPSRPPAHQTNVPAPFPHPEDARPEIPRDSVWRFYDARVRQQEMLTSRRLHLYLPCASAALFPEY